MKRKKQVTPRKKMKARTSKSKPKDQPFSRLALVILIALVSVGFWLYYHQSVKDQETPEAKLDSIILDNPDAEVLEMEEESQSTNSNTHSNLDESVPEVFRMEE